MSQCPYCKNQFSQPFMCTTCGAEKLYDATLEAVKVELAALTARVVELERDAGRYRWLKKNATDIKFSQHHVVAVTMHCLDASIEAAMRGTE